MRIAVFTDSFHPELGGIQDSILAITRALGERGHRLVVYAPMAAPGDYRLVGLPVGEIDLGGNVKVRRLFALPIPSSTGQSRLLVPTGQRWRELAHFQPDLIHTHTFLGAGWEALRAARRLRVPLVGTNHWAIGEFGAYTPLPAAVFARLSVKAVTRYYNHCAVVTGPSGSVIDEMLACGLRRPHRVVSNPIDTACFQPPTAAQRQALKRVLGFSEATILCAGRLAVEKNIDVLIRALARVAQQVPSAVLALAGHGSDRDRLQRLAGELGVAHRVRFLGTLDKPALADAFRAADVFAIASTSETQSMVLLQAMSAGLPAVGARWRALPEYIEDGAGLLACPGQHEQFAAHLVTLLQQPSLRMRMGDRGAQIAQRFSVSNVAAAWEEIYASTRAASPHPPNQHQGVIHET
jgi:1,2-diacylglycerol 3-alpha-glucosyltransferase